MNLTSLQTIKYLLKKYSVRPSKRLGQYFLIDKEVLEKTVESANLVKKDNVIEIGPGIGTLTKKLAKIAGKVIAVEKDKRMCQILKETLKDYKNVEIINRDVLKLSFNRLVKAELRQNYKVVANLPYYITSPFIRKFLESKFPPKEMVLLVQKEVAQRICAKPSKMSILAVAVQFYSKPEIVKIVLKRAFWPIPKVDSALVKITPSQILSKQNLGGQANTDKFFRVVKAGFSSPRKQLANNLSNQLNLNKEKIREIFKEIKIDPKVRAQELSIKNWMKILEAISRK